MSQEQIKDWVAEWAPKAAGTRIFDVPVTELDRDGLLAVIAFAGAQARDLQERASAERKMNALFLEARRG